RSAGDESVLTSSAAVCVCIVLPAVASARTTTCSPLVAAGLVAVTVTAAVAPAVSVVGLTVAVMPIGAVTDSVNICAVPATEAVFTVNVLAAFSESVATFGDKATLKSLASELNAVQPLVRSSQMSCTVN